VFKAVLFDVDGVLINSPPVHIASWHLILEPFGVRINEREIHLFEGRKALPVLQSILAQNGVTADQEVLDEAIRQKRAYFQSHMKPGLTESALLAVRQLRELGVLVSAVSGSTKANLHKMILPDQQLLFTAIFGAEDYEHSKPHPEPYLKACERLNLTPSECLVVENAPLGIESAKSAGIVVVALLSTLPREDLGGADYYISSLSELPLLVKGVFESKK